MQSLHGRARAGAQPVLKREETDEPAAERDEEHASAPAPRARRRARRRSRRSPSPGGGTRDCRRSPGRRWRRARSRRGRSGTSALRTFSGRTPRARAARRMAAANASLEAISAPAASARTREVSLGGCDATAVARPHASCTPSFATASTATISGSPSRIVPREQTHGDVGARGGVEGVGVLVDDAAALRGDVPARVREPGSGDAPRTPRARRPPALAAMTTSSQPPLFAYVGAADDAARRSARRARRCDARARRAARRRRCARRRVPELEPRALGARRTSR